MLSINAAISAAVVLALHWHDDLAVFALGRHAEHVACEGLRTVSLMNELLLENAGALRQARESLEDFQRSGSLSTRGGFGEQERNDHLASKTWPFILLQVCYSISSNSKVRHRK